MSVDLECVSGLCDAIFCNEVLCELEPLDDVVEACLLMALTAVTPNSDLLVS